MLPVASPEQSAKKTRKRRRPWIRDASHRRSHGNCSARISFLLPVALCRSWLSAGCPKDDSDSTTAVPVNQLVPEHAVSCQWKIGSGEQDPQCHDTDYLNLDSSFWAHELPALRFILLARLWNSAERLPVADAAHPISSLPSSSSLSIPSVIACPRAIFNRGNCSASFPWFRWHPLTLTKNRLLTPATSMHPPIGFTGRRLSITSSGSSLGRETASTDSAYAGSQTQCSSATLTSSLSRRSSVPRTEVLSPSNDGACMRGVLGTARDLAKTKSAAPSTSSAISVVRPWRLHSAACQGDTISLIEGLVECVKERRIRSHGACSSDSLSPAMLLDQLRTAVDIRNRRGLTALHGASFFGHAKTVAFLLEFGADPNAQALVKTMASKRPPSPSHSTPRSSDGILDAVRPSSAPPESQWVESGATALHFACIHGHESVIRVLLRYGANWNIRDERSCRPMDIAKLHKRAGALQLLLTASRSATPIVASPPKTKDTIAVGSSQSPDIALPKTSQPFETDMMRLSESMGKVSLQGSPALRFLEAVQTDFQRSIPSSINAREISVSRSSNRSCDPSRSRGQSQDSRSLKSWKRRVRSWVRFSRQIDPPHPSHSPTLLASFNTPLPPRESIA